MCRFTLSEKAQLLMEGDETFSEVTCPLVQALVLFLALVQHSVPANEYPEVVLLPVGVALLVTLSCHPAPAKEYPKWFCFRLDSLKI